MSYLVSCTYYLDFNYTLKWVNDGKHGSKNQNTGTQHFLKLLKIIILAFS